MLAPSPTETGILCSALDEVDYPMLLVAADMSLLHANRVAHQLLVAGHAVRIAAGALQCSCSADRAELMHAVDTACMQRLRTLVHLGERSGAKSAVAVVPLSAAGHGTVALMTFAKPTLCEELSIHWFARENHLTAGEQRVLQALCTGQSPQAIAQRHGVAMSTVRTQISNLREKMACKDIATIVRTVAALPPLVNALRPASAPRRVAQDA